MYNHVLLFDAMCFIILNAVLPETIIILCNERNYTNTMCGSKVFIENGKYLLLAYIELKPKNVDVILLNMA